MVHFRRLMCPYVGQADGFLCLLLGAWADFFSLLSE